MSTVDNFQGEENDIIILSLVRSNKQNNIGFLKSANRVCVALSRARNAFYIIGNASMLTQSELWADVITKLQANNNIGPALNLCCRKHPKTFTRVSDGFDIREKATDAESRLISSLASWSVRGSATITSARSSVTKFAHVLAATNWRITITGG